MKAKSFSVMAIALVSMVMLFSSCEKDNDEPAPAPKALAIVKVTPVDGFSSCAKNQVYTIEFSEKIVFDNTKYKNYIEYIESIATQDFAWTASYDGDKTITIKTTNIYFVRNNEFFWHLKKGMIKTADGRILADDATKDGVYLHFFTIK